MKYRHQAIYNTHPAVVQIDEETGAFDNDWNKIEIDEDKVSQEIKKLQSAEPMRLLRQQRNQKLIETDWTQYRDVTLSNDSDWQTYRQSLRDLPATTSPKLDDDGQLTNVTWPTKPE